MRPAVPLAAVLWFAVAPALATEVYRWVDADGVVHLQDQPAPGAEKLRVEALPTYKAPAPVPNAAAKAAKGGKPAATTAASYQTLQIVEPKPQETLWNIGGKLTVRMQLTPSLLPGHSVRLYFDDQLIEAPSPDAMTYSLTNAFRGTHVLRAEVLNEQGATLLGSSPVTFYVRQTSAVTPASP